MPFQPLARPLSAIAPRPLRWLFSGRIPLGRVTVFDGDPDLGKSTVLLDVASHVSSNVVMPDGSQGPTCHVLVMSSEDDPEDTIQPRVAINGANLDRVHFLDEVPDVKCQPRGLEMPLDLRAIEQEVASNQLFAIKRFQETRILCIFTPLLHCSKATT